VTGNGTAEAYTTSMWGMGMSHEITQLAEAEPVRYGEGNTSGADTRGVVALPGSMAISRMEGLHRNLGNPVGACGTRAGGGLWQGISKARVRAETGWRIGV
jgi:hypothetical protein